MISDELTQLHQELCAIEDEGMPVSQGEVVFGLLRAFGTESITHMIQQIKHAQELKESLLRLKEGADASRFFLEKLERMITNADH